MCEIAMKLHVCTPMCSLNFKTGEHGKLKSLASDFPIQTGAKGKHGTKKENVRVGREKWYDSEHQYAYPGLCSQVWNNIRI